jgi:hypothetical protein
VVPVSLPSLRIGALGATLLAAGVVDFVVGRLLLGSLPAPPPDGIPGPGALSALRQALETPAVFSHGMAAVLALALDCMAIAAILRDPSFAPPPRRLTLLVLATFALPVVALSLAFPLRPQLIFMALTATAFVGIVCALNTTLKRVPAMTKTMVWLLVAPVVLGYLDTLSRLIPWLSSRTWGGLTPTLSVGIEGSAVLAGILAPFALIPGPARRSLSLHLIMSFLVALVPTLAFGALSLLAWPETQSLAVRAVGLELQVPYAQPLYLAALLGYVMTAAFHLWPRARSGAVSETGIGLCALFFGGCGTFTLFRISLLMLGLLLVALGVHRHAEAAA